jgi:hypothetical protein
MSSAGARLRKLAQAVQAAQAGGRTRKAGATGAGAALHEVEQKPCPWPPGEAAVPG